MLKVINFSRFEDECDEFFEFDDECDEFSGFDDDGDDVNVSWLKTNKMDLSGGGNLKD